MTTDAIDDIIKLLRERRELGLKQYETTVSATADTDWFQHWLEECLDSLPYALAARDRQQFLEAEVKRLLLAEYDCRKSLSKAGFVGDDGSLESLIDSVLRSREKYADDYFIEVCNSAKCRKLLIDESVPDTMTLLEMITEVIGRISRFREQVQKTNNSNLGQYIDGCKQQLVNANLPSELLLKDMIAEVIKQRDSAIQREAETAEVITRLTTEVDRLKQGMREFGDSFEGFLNSADDRLCDCKNTLPCGRVCNWCRETAGSKTVARGREQRAELELLRRENSNLKYVVDNYTALLVSKVQEMIK